MTVFINQNKIKGLINLGILSLTLRTGVNKFKLLIILGNKKSLLFSLSNSSV